MGGRKNPLAPPADRVAILYDNCHRLWARFFQYAIFLDLEREIYASIDRGEPPSGAREKNFPPTRFCRATRSCIVGCARVERRLTRSN